VLRATEVHLLHHPAPANLPPPFLAPP
jgi:hypothetical protein